MQHDNLLAQHKLLLAIIATDWATRLDHKVAAVIIERYFRKYACARVSLRYLQQATGATRSNIITSLRRLLENGAFSLIREGAGTRPTEYGLNFAFSSSGIVGSTSSDGERSGLVGDTACGIAGDTSSVASGIVDGTESSLTEAPRQGVLTVRENSCAAPTAPPADAFEGAAAGTAQEGFEELWNAYGYKRGKPEARKAYSRLAPDGGLHRRLVDSANAWRESWAAQNKPDAPRFTLAKWLEREEYECEPPTGYKPKERQAKTKHAAAIKDGISAPLTIVGLETIGDPFGGDYRAILKLSDAAGHQQEHLLQLIEGGECASGQAHINKLQNAFGSDPSEWTTATIRLELDRGKIVDVIAEKRPALRRKRVSGKVTDAEIRKNFRGEPYLELIVELPDGSYVDAVEASLAPDRQNELQELAACAGLANVQDSDEFIGRTMTFIVNDKNEFVEAIPSDVLERTEVQAGDAEPHNEPSFDMDDFMARAKRITGEAA